jgi:hypothetical protein
MLKIPTSISDAVAGDGNFIYWDNLKGFID